MDHWDLYHGDIPPHISEAAKAPAMLRLRQVGMNCGCEYTAFPLFKGLAPYSRFDHSLGVALIVWHFTEDIRQSLSALFHDISTPVFAHVVDFLQGDHLKQEATEGKTGELIAGSPEISALLGKLDLNPCDVEDYHRFPIADNFSPALSADRLEYTLGNAVNYGLCSKKEAGNIYADLYVGQNEVGVPELAFRTYESGCRFGNLALSCGRIYVSNEDRYAMEKLAGILKDAIAKGYLSAESLYSSEPAVIEQLLHSPAADAWTQFRSCSQILLHSEPAEGRLQVFAKKRYIDPLINGKRLSSLSADFYKEVTDFLNEPQDQWLSAVKTSG